MVWQNAEGGDDEDSFTGATGTAVMCQTTERALTLLARQLLDANRGGTGPHFWLALGH